MNKYQKYIGTMMYAMNRGSASSSIAANPKVLGIKDIIDGTSNTVLVGEKA